MIQCLLCKTNHEMVVCWHCHLEMKKDFQEQILILKRKGVE